MKKKVVDLSVSTDHSAFIVAGGFLLTMGDNREAQLGIGHTKSAIREPSLVKKIADKFVTVKMGKFINSLTIASNRNLSFLTEISIVTLLL